MWCQRGEHCHARTSRLRREREGEVRRAPHVLRSENDRPLAHVLAHRVHASAHRGHLVRGEGEAHRRAAPDDLHEQVHAARHVQETGCVVPDSARAPDDVVDVGDDPLICTRHQTRKALHRQVGDVDEQPEGEEQTHRHAHDLEHRAVDVGEDTYHRVIVRAVVQTHPIVRAGDVRGPKHIEGRESMMHVADERDAPQSEPGIVDARGE